MIVDLGEIEQRVDALSQKRCLGSFLGLFKDGVDLLLPPDDISTAECAERFRWLRTADGRGKRLWSRSLTPYLVGPMDAWDDPLVQEVIIVKPGRTGGTVAFENALFKEMRFGPMGDWLWYLASEPEAKAYANKQVKALFEDHPEIAAKVGEGKSDDNISDKRVSGRSLSWLAANNKTITNREARNIIGDEIDTFSPRMCASFLDQARIRGRMIGNRRRVGMTSHPDRGWGTGIASAWTLSDKGIFLWECPECALWSSPHPTKFHDDVPRATLQYTRAESGTPTDERIALARETAAIVCPHCGAALNDAQRMGMIDGGHWLQGGHRFDADHGAVGETDLNPSRGFWVHGTMSKSITHADLARDRETGLDDFDRTKKTLKLREITAKVFGEVFEGAGDGAGLDGAELLRRSREAAKAEGGYLSGEVPDGVLFLTAAIDVQHARFDVGIWGWDAAGRSWLIDRYAIRTRRWDDGQDRDIRPSERIEDWDVLVPAAIDRLVALRRDPTLALPIAATTIDSSDGNVTWKAYEFARRMDGRRWGTWRKVMVIKGAGAKSAPEVTTTPTLLSKDQQGRPISPPVRLYSLGVHRLKMQAVERLATSDGGPGQCYFPRDVSRRAVDEFFAERLMDGRWVRNGDNESLDLFGYAEGARLMLDPDRQEIVWTDPAKRPVWATAVSLQPEGGDPADAASAPVKAAPQPSIYERMDRINRRKNPDG